MYTRVYICSEIVMRLEWCVPDHIASGLRALCSHLHQVHREPSFIDDKFGIHTPRLRVHTGYSSEASARATPAKPKSNFECVCSPSDVNNVRCSNARLLCDSERLHVHAYPYYTTNTGHKAKKIMCLKIIELFISMQYSSPIPTLPIDYIITSDEPQVYQDSRWLMGINLPTRRLLNLREEASVVKEHSAPPPSTA